MTLIDLGALQMYFKVENDEKVMEAFKNLVRLNDMKKDG
jgi:hypothetical protein